MPEQDAIRRWTHLTRAKGEELRLGDEIVVVVEKVTKKKVFLAIEAPLDVSVLKLEVAEAVRREAERHPPF